MQYNMKVCILLDITVHRYQHHMWTFVVLIPYGTQPRALCAHNDKNTHGCADFGFELIPSKERASIAYMGERCVTAYEMNHHTVSTLST